MFGEGTVPTAFTLVDSTPYPGGGVHLTYDSAGEPTYGDMTVDESGALDG